MPRPSAWKLVGYATPNAARRAVSRLALVAASAIVLLHATSVAAQPESTLDCIDDAWRWTEFTTRDGLPSADILSIIETNGGTPWAATTGGLAWYDGYWWNPVSLPEIDNNRLITILQPADDERVWVVSGEQLYLGDRSGFKPVPVVWQGKPVRVLNVAPLSGDQDFLVQGLIQYGASLILRSQRGQLQEMSLPASRSELVDVSLRTTRRPGIILLAGNKLFRWDDDGWVPFFTCPSENSNLLQIEENERGDGLMQLTDLRSNLSTWTWSQSKPPCEITERMDEYIQGMDVSLQGDILAALHSGRIRIGLTDSDWREFAGPKTPRSAAALWWSRNGNIWLGSENGLLLFRAVPRRWSNWHPGNSSGRSRIHAVLPRSDGSIWLGTADGIAIIRETQAPEYVSMIDGQELGLVTALAEDRNGRIWVGSGSSFDGAWCYESGKWRHFGEAEGLPAPRVHRICINRAGEAVLLGMRDRYRHRINDDPGVFVHRNGRFEQITGSDGNPLGRIYDFAEGADGTQWFASSGGIIRRAGDQWTHWTLEDGLRHSRVYAMTLAPDGRVWFGHEKRDGLGYIKPDGTIHYVDRINERERFHVNALCMAHDGTLWVADKGAILFLQDGSWSSVGLAEGLPAAQVWTLALAKDRVLVGMLGAGLSQLRLEDLRAPPPSVRIRRPVVDDQEVLVRWRVQTYWAQVPSEIVATRYQVDGGNWSDWSHANEARLANLTPGEHRFRVQAHGLVSHVMPAVEETRFEVVRPYYRRAEFLGPIGGLAALSLVTIGIQGRKRRRQQQKLRENEQIFRQLTENIRDVFWLRDCDTGRLLYVSPAHEAIWGDPVEVLYRDSQSWLDRIHPEDRARVADAFLSDEHRPSENAIEYRITTPDGKLRWILDRGFPIRDDRGRVIRIAGIAENITDRKEAEIAQQRAARQLQSILDNATAVIYVKDLDGRYLLINSHFELLFNVTRQGIIGRTDYDIFPPEFANRFRANDLAALQANGAITLEEQALQADGVHDYVSVKFPLFDTDGKPYATCGISTDISLLKRTEETLRRHAIAFDTIADALLMIDIDRCITDINPACERMFGYDRDELIGQPISILLGTDDVQALMPIIRDSLNTRHRWNGEVCHIHKDGHAVLGDVSLVAVLDKSGTRIGSIAVVRDVTEKRLAEEEKARLEAQLRHVQRIETIGKLTSNVSHDFSNLLTGILLNTALAKKKFDGAHPATPYIDAIEDAALQARGVTGALLNFAHRALADCKPVDLAAALAPTIRLLKRFLEPQIAVQVEMPPLGEAWCVADETLLQQAVMNVSINARDAMPSGGLLRIALSRAASPSPEAADCPDELRIVVADTGVGMPPDVLTRAFEPFFTTKPRGEGTGLGLSSVQSIVHSHNGRIHLESVPGRGTSVYITLPACAPPAPRAAPAAAPVKDRLGDKTVLVVEDNPFVRSIIVSAIRATGYEAIPAGDGAEALRVAQPGVTRLVGAVVDLDLPQKDGDQVIDDLHAVFPSLPVIRMTGRAVAPTSAGNGGFLLRKPFQMSEFVELLQKAMK